MAQPSVILATASYDHTIRFWEAKSGRCYRTIQYPDSVSIDSGLLEPLSFCLHILHLSIHQCKASVFRRVLEGKFWPLISLAIYCQLLEKLFFSHKTPSNTSIWCNFCTQSPDIIWLTIAQNFYKLCHFQIKIRLHYEIEGVADKMISLLIPFFDWWKQIIIRCQVTAVCYNHVSYIFFFHFDNRSKFFVDVLFIRILA